MENVETLLGRSYADLAAGVDLGNPVPEPELIGEESYVSLLLQGISLVLPDNEHIGVVQLHSAKHEGFEAYSGPIPGGVRFSMTRNAVRKTLGTPHSHGERQVVPILGEKPAWDSYVFGALRVHIEYLPGAGTVGLVSLTRAQA